MASYYMYMYHALLRVGSSVPSAKRDREFTQVFNSSLFSIRWFSPSQPLFLFLQFPIDSLLHLLVMMMMVWEFNGTSTPKGSYSAKTGDNDCNVNSSRYSRRTALCESIRYQAKSEQNVRQDPIPRVRHGDLFSDSFVRSFLPFFLPSFLSSLIY